MSVTALVVCPDCMGERGNVVCPFCLGQGHYAVNRTPEGKVPEKYREWLPPLLPEVPRARPS